MARDSIDANSAANRQPGILTWLTALVEPGTVVELRALDVRQSYGKPVTMTGFFDSEHLVEMARDAALLDMRSRGVYFTLNPLHRDLLSRCANRCDIARHGESTSAAHVLRRCWLLLDFDPVRIAGVSSSDVELQQAQQAACAVCKFLTDDQSWPAPVQALSGNGYHLLFRIDLPTEDGELVKRVLRTLSQRFSTDQVKLDTAVFDPPRICKLYGTHARKGDSTTERPHRLSRVIEIPNELVIVSRDQLERIAALTTSANSTNPPPLASSTVPLTESTRNSVLSRARNYLAKVPPAISGQEGHNAAFHAACVLVKGFALSAADAMPLLAEWNSSCQPPWAEAELLHKLHDAEKAPGEVGKLLGNSPSQPMAKSGAASSEQTSVVILPAGTRVRAKDRDNYGEVVNDDGGATVAVHFVSPGGDHATKQISRELLILADGTPLVPTGFNLSLLTSPEFANADFRQHFLIKRCLVAGQPCILGGPKKVLKTALLVEMAVSLGTGTPFLSHPDFAVPEPINVMLLSGESGGFTLQETARRIALARNRLLSSASVFWGFDLPQLGNGEHLKELTKEIERRSIKVAIIDPAYLCLLSASTSANITANVFAMGQLLKGLSDIGRRTGCTLIIAHHTRKTDRNNPFRVPDLEDLSGSGFAEWARQWMLLNRREAYKAGTGEHRLWLNVGGSAGHSGTWALDISEGTIDDNGGRTWSVSVGNASEAIQEARSSKEQKRQSEKQIKLKNDLDRIRDVLRKASGPLAKSKIRDMAGISSTRFPAAIASMLNSGEIEDAEFKGANGQKYVGFKLADPEAGQPDNTVGQTFRPPANQQPDTGASIKAPRPCPAAGVSLGQDRNTSGVRLPGGRDSPTSAGVDWG